jgi:hypothetical protein
MPVGAPTKSFSARCAASTRRARSKPSRHTSFSATASDDSRAADDDNPAPTGTSEEK